MSLEDKIQHKLIDFEGTPPIDGWQALSKKLDRPFESTIAQKVGKLEFSPNPSAWAAIASGLDGSLESIIKHKVENHAATPPTDVWYGINAEMTNSAAFEQNIASKVKDLHASVPVATWKYIATRLDKLVAAKRRRQFLTAAAILIGAIIPSSNLFDNWTDFSGLYFAQNDSANESVFAEQTQNKNEGQVSTNSIQPKEALKYNPSRATESGQKSLDDNYLAKGKSPSQFKSLWPDKQHEASSNFVAADNKSSNSIFSSNSKSLTSFALSDQYMIGINDDVLLVGASDQFEQLSPIISKLDEILNKLNEKKDVAIFSLSSGPCNQNFFADGELSEFARFNNDLDKRGWYNSIGGSFGFQMRPRFQLGIGLGITQASSQMHFSIDESTVEYGSSYKKVNYATNSNSILEKSNTISQMGLFTDGLDKTVAAGSDYTLISEFTWIDVPLSLKYTLPLNDKFGFVFTGGVNGRFLLNAHAFLPSLNKGSIVEIDANYANEFYKPYLGALGGVAFQVSLIENLDIQLGIEHIRGLSSIVKTDQYIGIKPSQTGLKLSIIQKM